MSSATMVTRVRPGSAMRLTREGDYAVRVMVDLAAPAR